MVSLLRRVRPLTCGTPLQEQLDTLLATLDAAAFQQCFVAWVGSVNSQPAGMIAIDGMSSRRSFAKKGAKPPLHMLTAFAARQRLVLGHQATRAKSNEFIAIPRLLDMLAIEGAIDAVGCRRAIAAKVVGEKTDDALALKAIRAA